MISAATINAEIVTVKSKEALLLRASPPSRISFYFISNKLLTLPICLVAIGNQSEELGKEEKSGELENKICSVIFLISIDSGLVQILLNKLAFLPCRWPLGICLIKPLQGCKMLCLFARLQIDFF